MKKVIFEPKNTDVINFDNIGIEDVIFVKKRHEYYGSIVFNENTRQWVCISKRGYNSFDENDLGLAMNWFGNNCSFFVV